MVIFFNLIISILATLLLLALGAGIYILMCLGRMKMFQKAGEADWKAFVPFYRDYVLCKLTMGAGWYFILGYIPVIGFLMDVVYAVMVCRAYKQSAPMALLYFLFGFIAELIIGFGSSSYRGYEDLKDFIKDMFGYDDPLTTKAPKPEPADTPVKTSPEPVDTPTQAESEHKEDPVQGGAESQVPDSDAEETKKDRDSDTPSAN